MSPFPPPPVLEDYEPGARHRSVPFGLGIVQEIEVRRIGRWGRRRYEHRGRFVSPDVIGPWTTWRPTDRHEWKQAVQNKIR